MTRDEIKAVAIECGFTLREQAPGRMDLNPYVYEFANRLITTEREECALVCDEWQERFLDRMVMGAPHLCAKQIRSRGAT